MSLMDGTLAGSVLTMDVGPEQLPGRVRLVAGRCLADQQPHRGHGAGPGYTNWAASSRAIWRIWLFSTNHCR